MISIERQHLDWYATKPDDVKQLLKAIGNEISGSVWEPACGTGHISEVMKANGYNVFSSDIVDRGYNDITGDFLSLDCKDQFDIIITNPPYSLAQEFVEHAMKQVKDGGLAIFLMRTLFVDGQARYNDLYSKCNPKYIYSFVKRTYGLIGGDSDNKSSTAMSHSWFIFQKGFSGDTIFRWMDNRIEIT